MESDRRLTLNEIHTGHLERPTCGGQTNRRGSRSHFHTLAVRCSHFCTTKEKLFKNRISPKFRVFIHGKHSLLLRFIVVYYCHSLHRDSNVVWKNCNCNLRIHHFAVKYSFLSCCNGYHATRVKWCASEQKGQSEVLTCGPSYPGGVIGGTGLATWGPGRLVSALFHTCHTEGQLCYYVDTHMVQASRSKSRTIVLRLQNKHITTRRLGSKDKRIFLCLPCKSCCSIILFTY